MVQPYSFRLFTPDETPRAVALVLRVFDAFVAPGLPSEGVAEFRRYAEPAAMRERMEAGNIVLGCEADGELAGVMELRERQHIAFFFVAAERQRSGLGRAMLEFAIKHLRTLTPGLSQLTVNASLNAVPAYERLGFTPADTPQTTNGIHYQPMHLQLRPLSPPL